MVQFYSAMSLSALARQGNPAEVRDELIKQLIVLRIDPTPAVQGVGDKSSHDDVEVVARLVSLARANGYLVELRAGGRGNPDIRFVSPAGMPTLQSGHHSMA
jgi:hypothetical protein